MILKIKPTLNSLKISSTENDAAPPTTTQVPYIMSELLPTQSTQGKQALA